MRRRLQSAAALPLRRRALPQVALDAALLALAYWLAFALRFDATLPPEGDYRTLFEATVLPAVLIGLLVLTGFGVYLRSARYASRSDDVRVVQAAVVAVVGIVVWTALLGPSTAFPPYRTVTLPTSVVAVYGLALSLLLLGSRFAVHGFFDRRGFRPARGARRVLIVGAGEGGRLLLREMLRNPGLQYDPVGFVDDDPLKKGLRVDRGLRVLGTTDDLARIVAEVEPDEVQIAIPSAPGAVRAKVVAACRAAGIPVRTMPTVFEMLRGGAPITRQLRGVRVEDILGREPVTMDLDRIGAYLTGQVVLVTGAGGSIGSELCRQIARCGPTRLVLLDHAEDNLFEVHRELTQDRHFLECAPVLADCKEEERMREVLAKYRPAVVFHAAAYKHVGLMEANPIEAVRNNAIATRVMTRAAADHGVRTFVLVSTDKAVAPKTVMGASKALSEWAMELAAAQHPQMRCCAVRFGNVLGSSGSVVPIFRRQIAAGGPVTVTDKRMTRYFMTIPEAVQLILRAGSLEEPSGSVFVLEMGDPIRIWDLAEDMIRLSGLEPGEDVLIEETAPRQGEKLHEQLFEPHERPQATKAQKVVRADRRRYDPAWIERALDEVSLLVLEDDAAGLADVVARLSAEAQAAQEPTTDRTPA